MWLPDKVIASVNERRWAKHDGADGWCYVRPATTREAEARIMQQEGTPQHDG